MSTNVAHDYSGTVSQLRSRVAEYNARIQQAIKSKKLKESYEQKIKLMEESEAVFNSILGSMKPIYDDTQEYSARRKQNSMQNINNALRKAGEIITEATEGIKFNIEGDEAWLVTPDGLDVDTVEGGGYCQISSAFIRAVIMQTNAESLNTMILDEVFSLVSPENSATLSLYLGAMVEEMQVISIEQKPQVYSNVDCTMYHFNKVGNHSVVTKTIVEREGIGE